ncbi:MAG TPA: MATE family efflux transporter [Clostridiales bacterium]|nr:MATE family efflux transporter [Clostridiales bacterium]
MSFLTKNKEMDMTTGRLLPKILAFAIPLALSGVLQLLFNAVDLIVIGNFSKTKVISLAAVSSNNSLINLFVNVAIGISLGVNVVMAQAIGEGNAKKAERTVHTAMLLSVVIGLVIMLIGTLGARQFLEWMHANPDVIDKAHTYLFIYFFGAPANIVYNFGAALLRAKGDTKRPLFYLTIAGVINAGLNILLVVPGKMDVAGVAVATIVSQYISALLVVLALMREEGVLRLSLKKLRFHKEQLRRILRIGLPSGVLSSFFSIANIIIQSAMNGFSAAVIAGNATGISLEAFIYTSMNAVAGTAGTFSGQNYGAGKYKRIKRVMLNCCLIEMGVGIILGGLFMLLRHPLASLYTTDPEVVKVAGERMMVILPFYFVCGVVEVLVGCMRGMNYSLLPTFASFLSVCVYRIVWVYTLFRKYRTTRALWMSYPISWIINFAIDLVMIILVFRQVFRTHEKRGEQGESLITDE